MPGGWRPTLSPQPSLSSFVSAGGGDEDNPRRWPNAVDEVLIRNIALAHAWFERITAGETFAAIAKAEAASKRRIQQMIGLAFLAPDIVRDVMDGKQPVGLTSNWCKNHELPADWQAQRALIASL